jgi:hypothetical protein
MYGISEEQILDWIDQCDSELKKLQNAKDFLYRSYYERDLIDYSVEENLRQRFGERIANLNAKRELLFKMLEQVRTDDLIIMFDYQFPVTLVNQLPEDLRKEFFNFVYEI